jgi:hypothetical protein
MEELVDVSDRENLRIITNVKFVEHEESISKENKFSVKIKASNDRGGVQKNGKENVKTGLGLDQHNQVKKKTTSSKTCDNNSQISKPRPVVHKNLDRPDISQ